MGCVHLHHDMIVHAAAHRPPRVRAPCTIFYAFPSDGCQVRCLQLKGRKPREITRSRQRLEVIFVSHRRGLLNGTGVSTFPSPVLGVLEDAVPQRKKKMPLRTEENIFVKWGGEGGADTTAKGASSAPPCSAAYTRPRVQVAPLSRGT